MTDLISYREGYKKAVDDVVSEINIMYKKSNNDLASVEELDSRVWKHVGKSLAYNAMYDFCWSIDFEKVKIK